MSAKDMKAAKPEPVDPAAGDLESATDSSDSIPAVSARTHREPKSLRQIASDLWHPQPGASASAGGQAAPSAREIVNGLDSKERMLGTALTALDLVLTIVVYAYWRHSGTLKVRHYAPDFLIAGLVGIAILALGAGLRRRALLGFASFIVGMELISFGLVYGILYLFFGGWLILRVMRRQKQGQVRTRTTAATAGARSSTTRRAPSATPRPPSASKRYTPPRRAKTSAKGR